MDLLDDARVFDLEASLRREQGRFHEALGLLDQALVLVRGEQAQRVLLNRATVLEALGDFEGAVISLPTESRSDSMHSGLIALDWQPLKVVFLSAAFHRDRRTSNLRGFDFDSTAGSISAKLNF